MSEGAGATVTAYLVRNGLGRASACVEDARMHTSSESKDSSPSMTREVRGIVGDCMTMCGESQHHHGRDPVWTERWASAQEPDASRWQKEA